MFLTFFTVFILAFIFSFLLTPKIRNFALKLNFTDQPCPPRKQHPQATPLLGGLALFLACIFTILALFLFTDYLSLFFQKAHFLSGWGGWQVRFLDLQKGILPFKYLLGILASSLILLLGGILDDKYNLKPKLQFIFPLLAVIIVVVSGIGIKTVANPLTSQILNFEAYKIQIFNFQGIPYFFTPIADIFTLVWLLGMIYTTKFLDGLDGLVSGASIIGSVILFIVSLGLGQPVVAVLALILAGVNLGFLPYNFYKARIFLGEFGSTWLGFMLGVLAIIGDAKVSITLLVMGIPIFDALLVILRRVFKEKKSPFQGDRKHLHFRLLDRGFSHRQTVVFLYFLILIFGLTGLFLQNQSRIWLLIILIIVMIGLGVWLVSKKKLREKLTKIK